jgi:hypothetical protein
LLEWEHKHWDPRCLRNQPQPDKSKRSNKNSKN